MGMTHVLDVGHPDPLAMLVSAAMERGNLDLPCGLLVTDISPKIGHIPRAERRDPSPLSLEIFQSQLHSSKALIMPPTDVAAPAFAQPRSPTFTQAAIRFTVSTALIGLCLLLAGL